MSVKNFFGRFAAASIMLTLSASAQANGLTLTAAGIADGFTMTKYGSETTTGSYSFLSAAALPNGDLAVVDYAQGILKEYSDSDGQTLSSYSRSLSVPKIVNIANAGGHTYVDVNGASSIYELNPTTFTLTAISTPGLTFTYGFAADPSNGHLIAATSQGLADINPLTGSHTIIYANGGIDGVSVTPDSKYAIAEASGTIYKVDIATGAAVRITGADGHSPDGTGVISGGSYSGYYITNNNDGTLSLINPATNVGTIIASGGSRGDFTSPDTNDGSLLLAEYGNSYRLVAPNGNFGAVPEPSTFALLGLGGIGLAVGAHRRRRVAIS